MGKDKRKVRLDKTSGTAHADFIGFSSFADCGSVSDASSFTTPSTNSLWSPIYTGSDETLQVLFPRISQKRDATTKVKALQQLQSFLSSTPSDSSSNYSDDRVLRRTQVEAIQHFAWLYYNKVHFDASPIVRAAALEVWLRAYDRIPKAVSQLVISVQPELLGMIFTASQADRGFRSSAQQINELLDGQSDWPWEHGLIELYASRMLSFGRSSAMYDALFAKKNSKGDDRTSQETAELSESHKDAAEEQFERIVGTCLDALRLFILSSRSERRTGLDTAIWWKTLASGMPALRLKTLHLFMTCCQNKVSIPSHAGTLLTQELSSERQVTNVPAVMNALVTYISYIRQSPPADEGFDTSLFVKPVTKVLKKACYGAPANDWAPALLPLSALLGKVKPEYASSVLTGAWGSRSLVLGGDRDRFVLAKAVAESASHWLLLARPSLRTNAEESSSLTIPAQELATLWVETFQFSLSIQQASSKTSPLAIAHSALLDQLCSDLVRFHETFLGNDSAFRCLIDHERFWSESLDLEGCDLGTTSMLLQRLQKLEGKKKLLPQVRKLFHSTLFNYPQSSGASPSQNAYLFFTAAVKCFESPSLFEENHEMLTKFIMNDLLRWLILHTGRISHDETSLQIVNHDFDILYHTLHGLPDRQEIWNVIVRELIAAQCDLITLTLGLEYLATTFAADSDWISCSSLSKFAISQGDTVSQRDLSVDQNDLENVDWNASAHGDYYSYLDFFNVCVGFPLQDAFREERLLLDDIDEFAVFRNPLVGRDVITHWIDSSTCQSHSKMSPLLEVLLRMIWQNKKDQSSPFVMSEDDSICIMLQAWKIDGRSCHEFLHRLLQQDTSRQSRFLSSASNHLSKELFELLESVGEANKLVSQWVSRACRLFGLTETVDPVNASLAIQVRRNILLPNEEGCDPFVVWKNRESIGSYTLAIFNRLPGPSQRLSLLLGDSHNLCDDSKMDTILRLLMLTSETFHLSDLSAVWKREGKSKQLFTLLVGAGGLDREFLSPAIDRLIRNLNANLSKRNEGYIEETMRIFTTLSMIVMCLFGPLFDSAGLVPEDVVEGQKILYVADPEEPDIRTPAIVKKVHLDVQTGDYFTITLVDQSENHERQTVLERLRRDSNSTNARTEFPVLEGISSQAERLRARDLILLKLVKPLLIPSADTPSLVSLLAESLTLLGGYIGFGEEKGIGSPKYDVHKILTSCDVKLQDALERDDNDSVIQLMWFSSLGLGYGLNCDPIKWSHRCLQLSLLDSFEAIENKYNSEWSSGNTEMDCGVLSWLTATMEHILMEIQVGGKEPGFVKRHLTLLFRVATNVLSIGMDEKLTGALSIGSRAIEEGTRAIGRNVEACFDMSPIATDSFVSLVRCFCFETEGVAYWNKTPSLILEEVMNTCSIRSELLGWFAAACDANYAELFSVLFDKEKRELAFRLLKIAADGRAPFQKSDRPTPFALTSRLAHWSVGLAEDEIEELEEDLLIVLEWIPEEILEKMEYWATEDLDGINEDQATGQLLSWLIFLRILDQAASVNFRNRPAFVSYLSKCGVFNHFMNLAILNEETINSGKRNSPPPVVLFEDMLFKDGRVSVTEVASVVLLRSIEVLPALSKRWWEEDCPKVYLSLVQNFVEKYVGPRILERELERIRNAPGVFGNMNVSASSVSREIRAEYVQDDFTLKVLINLPAAYPFRSAEVDCSKTLGVSQSRWKRWSLQIMMMLNNQGGTLIDALVLWKDNVDKEFEGIEACPVCYSVLHVKTHKLPGLQCKTCSNRFHSDCLMEWFRSSGKSQCVLCQQPWEGTRIQ